MDAFRAGGATGLSRCEQGPKHRVCTTTSLTTLQHCRAVAGAKAVVPCKAPRWRAGEQAAETIKSCGALHRERDGTIVANEAEAVARALTACMVRDTMLRKHVNLYVACGGTVICNFCAVSFLIQVIKTGYITNRSGTHAHQRVESAAFTFDMMNSF